MCNSGKIAFLSLIIYFLGSFNMNVERNSQPLNIDNISQNDNTNILLNNEPFQMQSLQLNQIQWNQQNQIQGNQII